METTPSDNDISRETMLRIQQDFLSAIISVTRKRKMKVIGNIRRLKKYLENQYLDFNFQIDGVSPLAQATVKFGVLEKLLQVERVDLNFRTCDGRTSLYSAIMLPQTDSMNLLMSKGAELEPKDNHGRTPLSLAAELGRIDHLKLLVESNVDINSTDERGWSPLFWAISSKQNHVVEYLLSRRGIAVGEKDVDGRTPFVIAAQAENAESLRLLTNVAATTKEYFNIEGSPLAWAILQKDITTVRICLQADCRLGIRQVSGRTPLSIATEVGSSDIARLLIETGANPNAADETTWPILKHLSFEGYMPSNSFLRYVDCSISNASPNSTGEKPLPLATETENIGVMKLLLEAGADVNTCDTAGLTALTWAVKRKLEPAVRLLLAYPETEVDCRDKHGRTPFSMAAQLGDVHILKKIAQRSPDTNTEDEHQRTPLILATKNKHESAAEVLLSLPETRIDHQDDQGRTAFSFAAENELVETMQMLLEKQADPHIVDSHGCTSFWWFLNARKQWLDSLENAKFAEVNPFRLQALVRALPTPNKQDPSGRNWFSWAASYGDEEIVEYFLLDDGKVDVNIRDNTQETFSKTPLLWALENEGKAMIELLKLRDHLSMHTIIEELHSPRKGHSENGDRKKKLFTLIKALANTGYNLNQPDSNGRTPLHLACLYEDEEVVLTLVRKADQNSKDHNAKIPLQYALAARNMKIVNLLLDARGAEISSISSQEWFNLRAERPSWVQITKRMQREGFDLELIDNPQCDWLPRARESRLCLCRTGSTWSRFPLHFGIHDIMMDHNTYLKHSHSEFGHRSFTHICVNFPIEEEEESARVRCPWGIAWISSKTTEGLADGFISTLPSACIPQNPADFVGQFLTCLYHEWKNFCTDASKRVEELRGDQVRKKGRSFNLVNRLAKNSQSRARLRQCLQSHVEQLRDMVNIDPSFNLEQKSRILAAIDDLAQVVTTKLDHLEQAIRELLQIELAWVSTNESASFKRLSWITFVFLPLMFVSSLFGMNVDLLQNNPDWKWYLLFGGLSLILTGTLWMASKFFPISFQKQLSRAPRKHSHKNGASSKATSNMC
ncbi:unnamed protein product [Penicillium salamii]|uniref:Mg2+ transporter protein, CorA-like/Zinc transport protein ZntB n=1 Tax=Penicillium salamii TaxID=1612424 RepID=A0A9W4ICF3_9EURO|nr:unnamed protein product [Penicillium salamii]CAG7951882.1 unnamed protein product [Penicillium salamii]CAG8175727.1 unnamed protein product [Penicillium salamii]CAG8222866.1 unnamed protein product [Penicillium salamii]CAG8224169.1 unnamed protein product [Penicillium salamii]